MKKAANIKKIMEVLYKYGHKHRISELRDYDEFKDFKICYNQGASTLLKRSVISFVYLKDFFIDNRVYFTEFDYLKFLSFIKDNNAFYYYTKDVGKDTEIHFLTFDEYNSLENVISKIAELSLKSKLTNKEIISNFTDSEVAYLYRHESLFLNDFESFVENF